MFRVNSILVQSWGHRKAVFSRMEAEHFGRTGGVTVVRLTLSDAARRTSGVMSSQAALMLLKQA
jgi:hypothetical protein